MPNLDESQESRRLTLLQYGETGTGKTRRAASAVQFGPVYIFDFDNQAHAIGDWYPKGSLERKNIVYDSYSDFGGRNDACLKVYAKLREFWALVAENKFPYATIVWDSWTGWESIYLNQVMKSNPKFERMATEIYIDEKTKTKQFIYTPQQADYRIHAHNEGQFIAELTHFPCNIIVNSHISISKDDLTGRIDRGLAAAGKLSKLLPKFFTEVHRTYLDGKHHRVQISSDSTWSCKTRILPPESGHIDPDIKHFEAMAFRAPYLEGTKPVEVKPNEKR